MSEYTANQQLNDSKEHQLMNERKPLVLTNAPVGDPNDSKTWDLVL